MAEFDLTKQMEEAAKERSNIAKTLLAIQQSLDKLAPTMLKMEPVLASLEPAVNNLSAWRPRVDAAVGQLPNDLSDTRKQLEKIALAPFRTSKASDPSSSTAVDARTPATCSMKVPDHNTGDEDPGVMSLLPGSTPTSLISSPEDLPSPPLVAFEVTTLPPTTCSAKCSSSIIGSPASAFRITHATPTWLLPAPAFMLGPELKLQKAAPERCLSICFGRDMDMLKHMFMPDVHPTIKQQGRVLRPAPWPSFACSHVCTVLQLGEFRSLTKISSAGMPIQHSVGFLTGDELVLGCPVQPQSISSWEYLQYQLLHTWTNVRKEALREEKMLHFMVALMGLKPWLPWDCFSLQANFGLPHVTTRVLCVTSPWCPGVHNKAVSIQSLVVALYMAECCGELISVIATHPTWLLKLASPDGSPVYIQVRIGSILFIWTSQEAQFDREYLSIQLPLVDQVLWRILEYWCLDVQGLPLADAFFEDSFWPKQHIIEACLASPDHRFMVTNAVEWLYNHNSYGQHIEVGNRLNGKGRVPWLADGIVVTTPGYPLQAKKIPFPCTEIVTTRLFGSDEIKCLEVLSNILQCTDNYLSVIMFDEIEPQLTKHWKEFVVQGKAMVVSNITKPTMYTDVSPYRMKTGLQPLYVSISTAEGTSHRNNSIYQLVEQQLSFPASTCTHAHIQAAIGENQGAYSLCCNFSCHLPNTIATWVEYTDRQGTYSCGEITMDHHSRLGFLNLGVLLTWTHVSVVQITELPCTELSSQKHPMPSVDQLMMKRSYRCLVRANTSPKIMLECSATELIAWVLAYVRIFAAYSSQSAFFTRLNGWRVMGQPSVLGCTSLVGKQGFKEGGVSCLWPSSSIKYASATSITSISTKSPTMTTTSTMSKSSTSFKSTSTRATSVKATTTNLAAPWDPGKNSSAPAWGQVYREGYHHHSSGAMGPGQKFLGAGLGSSRVSRREECHGNNPQGRPSWPKWGVT